MKRGFTLVELLVGSAIFLLVVLLGASIVASALRVSGSTHQQLEVRREARAVFDRMALDFASAVRFDTYQIETVSGPNSVLSILTRPEQSDGVRLRRVDYHMETNGLFRSVRLTDWEEPQDLAAITRGPRELLSPAAGRMIAQVLWSDGTADLDAHEPPVRSSRRAIGVRVGLALAPEPHRKSRAQAPPQVIQTNGAWFGLSPDDEALGWRPAEKIFRLP
jgi:prepilin-type N-terminal cleavage/methylation domain-containing protein